MCLWPELFRFAWRYLLYKIWSHPSIFIVNLFLIFFVLQARPPRSSLTFWTTSSVRISSAWRRSEPTVGSATTGVSVSAVSTPRPPAGGDAPSVSQRRSNLCLFSHRLVLFILVKYTYALQLKLKRNSATLLVSSFYPSNVLTLAFFSPVFGHHQQMDLADSWV